ncbi:Helicase conserved C-terminal domain family protein [Saccharomyces cerevisiae]|nr:Helicase conserved C-terminal domain family protein [Saccharomyces cerevisiae]
MMNKKDRLGDVLATAQRIRRRYNKNGSSEPRLKTLDGLTSERWIQWLGLESDYHCSFSSTRNAEDVVAGEAASSDHDQKISRVTRKRPREPKSTNDILVAGQKLFGSSFEFRDLHQLRLCHEIYMADTPSVAVQAPPGYGKTELFHLPLIALASKGDVKYVSFLFVPYTVLLANCMIRLGRCGCLNVAPVRNFIEEGCDGVTDLYVGIYDDLASTNFTDRIAAWENIVECTFRTNNVKLGYLIVDEFHNFETEVYRQSQFGGITNLDFDAFEKAIFLSGTAPEAVADAALQRIGLTGLAKKSMDINELKRSEDLSRGLSSYPTRMFNLIKEKSEVPLGHVHKIWKKVESQPEEALKLLLALFESEPESKAIVVASTTNEVEELACSWRKYFRVVWIHGKLGAAEKVSRTKEFVTDGSMQVLIGTKLVTEGIDIKQLMMVIMLDNRLNIIELIQGVGRLRDGGLCYLLSRKNSWAARNRKGELPPIKEGCITEQVREFYGLESKKGKKGQHVGCCGSRTDLSADTVELIERMDRLAEKQATASMSIVALPSSFQESNSSDRYRKYCSSDEDSNTCIHGSANASTNVRTNATTTESTNSSTNATTTASTNVRTSATTTASINVRTSATTTESTNSSTNATTTASINSSTNATTTESTNSNTSATTTESTDSNTSATTTASTNSSTNATTTGSTNSSTNATTTASINVRTSATTTESTNSSTNATTTASTNVRTSATTTESTNSNTSATTTESTNSNTSATTTESTNSNTSATTTASTNSSTNATTTGSTNSSTSATTTASTNSSTNATTTGSTNSSTNATTTASINVRTSATTTESTNSSTNATTTASINVRTSATTTESTDSSTNATTTASTNSNTNATTTESTDSNTSATTTASTNSSTNATTTASTNSSTNATTTASTNSSTNATTTASTNSSTNATTTASTNSSTNATTTESTNASAKEDANKDGNTEDNRFHPVTDINKGPYKRKGSQMVLLERKKLKAQFPNTSENMNVLQFLGFRSDEIKHLFLYGIDIYFCPEGVFTQYGLCKGCQKMFELCVCWAGQKVSYRRMAWEALAVERMLRNDEEYKEYLEDIEPYHGDPVGYLKFFSVKRREIYSQIQRNYAWYLAITRRRETISVLDSTRGKQGSQVFRMSGRQIKELYYKVWSNLRESKTEVLQYFLNWDEKKCREEWEAKDDTVFVEALEKVGVFQRLRSMTSAGLQGPQYVKLQFSRHHRQLRSRYELSLGMHLRDQLALGVTPSKVPHWTAFLSMLIGLFCNKTFRQKLEYLLEQISEVWLLPHWLDLANVEVLAADNTRVPLYMLMVAVHKELDSDDVPDGRFDILLCRDSSREVGE